MVNASLGIVTEGIRFGSFSRVLLVGTNGRLGLGSQKIKASAISALGDSPTRSIKRAERLGFWFASAGSTRTVFDMMGQTARTVGISRSDERWVGPECVRKCSYRWAPYM